MEWEQQRRRVATIARHLTDSSSLHALAYEKIRQPGAHTAVIIGGMVLDIQATPTGGSLVHGSTTPGEVRYVRGGVARNVAENMSLLGTSPFLISVVGEDVAGDSMVSHWKSMGLSIEGIRRCKGTTTPVVSAVFDKQGELAAAVADIYAIEEHLTSEWINRFADIIKGASVLMLDANLMPSPMEAACSLAREANVPVWFEPVSVAKSVRASKILHLVDDEYHLYARDFEPYATKMTYLSPNEAELVAMAEYLYQNGVQTKPLDDDDVPPGKNLREPSASIWRMRHSIQTLLDMGLQYIFLTMGSHGAVWCSANTMSFGPHTSRPAQKSELSRQQQRPSATNWTSSTPNSKEQKPRVTYVHFPALPASVVNLSGAGDCLVAGALVALSSSSDVKHALAYGVSASKWAVESDSNVPQDLSPGLVSEGAKKVFMSARELVL